ncbi:hypothetical protein ACGFNU_21095 [Spirillospora sp. NPDC048911]|uniref:hypothetical protein n=1 Tax=Spirillospora sp. NPDC048911 TaxID=3364527 RepID=UPI00371BE88A
MTLAGAVILAVIAGALHLKHRVPRVVAWLLLFVGFGASSTVTGFLGADLSAVAIGGVTIATIAAIGTLIYFWEEAVKCNGLHRVRTPLVALACGASIVLAGGSFFQMIENAAQKTGANVDEAVVSNLNGK